MLKKRYIKSRKVWKVTFEFPDAELPEGIAIKDVHLVGEFNDWDATITPMPRRQSGVFRAAVELETGQKYQFRYVVNGEHWCNVGMNGFGASAPAELLYEKFGITAESVVAQARAILEK